MSREDKLERLDREGRNTSSTDPKMMNSRVFIGNLPAEKVSRQDVETMFGSFGKILGVSLHKSYGFVQFDNVESANEAVRANNGKTVHGLRIGERHFEYKKKKKKEMKVSIYYSHFHKIRVLWSFTSLF